MGKSLKKLKIANLERRQNNGTSHLVLVEVQNWFKHSGKIVVAGSSKDETIHTLCPSNSTPMDFH